MKQEENKAFVPDIKVRGEGETHLPAGASSAQSRPLLQRKRLWVGIALVFFLFCIIFIIPVGYIPVLRNLSWWMGFSTQDTQSMSFGRTLLTWAGDSDRRTRPGNWSGDGEISLFDRNQRPGFSASGPHSGLFDLGRLNAVRRSQGLAPDGLLGVAFGEDVNETAVSRPVEGWSDQAQAAAAEQNAKEVYFGADADLAARAAAEGKGQQHSFDTSSLLPQAGIVGAAATDWLSMAVDKASAITNPQLEAISKNISQTNAPLSNMGGRLKAGQKPQQDLAMVWLMSMAGDRAKYLMLKKTLASSGYLAIDMPKKVYDSSGVGAGVQMSGGEMTANFESANQMLLAEEKCHDIASNANNIVQPRLEEAKGLVVSLRNVPKKCGDDMQTWSANLRSVKTNCNEVKQVFSNMQSFCGAKVQQGRCETARLDSYESSYNEICEGYENLSDEDKALRDQQLAEAAQDIDYEVRDSFNLSVDGEDPGGNDFFPQTKGVKI